MKVSGNPTPTDTLVHRLRLMAGSGGVLTRDRIKTVIESADRLEELDERIAIMMEGNNMNTNINFNFGGDANENS